jgi:hypothetical protein
MPLVQVRKADEVTYGTNVRALVARTPGGQYASHANDLKIVRVENRRGRRANGRANALERYTKGKGAPAVSKAFGGAMPARRFATAWARKPSVKTGMKMIEDAGGEPPTTRQWSGRNAVGRKLK